MSEVNYEQLVNEVQKLRLAGRRQRSFIRITIVLVTILFIVAAVPKSSRHDVIETGELILSDKSGKKMAVLEINKDGFPGLSLFDNKGTCRIDIELSDIDASIGIADSDGQQRATMSVNRFGATHLDISEPDGSLISLLASGKPDNTSEIALGNATDGMRLRISTRPDGSGIWFSGLPSGLNKIRGELL